MKYPYYKYNSSEEQLYSEMHTAYSRRVVWDTRIEYALTSLQELVFPVMTFCSCPQ